MGGGGGAGSKQGTMKVCVVGGGLHSHSADCKFIAATCDDRLYYANMQCTLCDII